MGVLKEHINIEENYNKLVWIAFSIVTAFKILLMGIFSSDYQIRMFMPFVETFLSGERDPYDFYYKNQMLSSFPYPPLMLLIESIGGLFVQWFHPGFNFLRNLLFKIPLLIFDILGFVFIRKISQKKINLNYSQLCRESG